LRVVADCDARAFTGVQKGVDAMRLVTGILAFGTLFVLPAFCAANGGTSEAPAIVGYVFPRDGALKPGQIDARGLDRINYAFASTKDGRLVSGSQADVQNLALLVALKKENPSLRILISVGGWLGSGDFSDIALTAQSRKVFVNSVMDFIAHNDLDGLDVDWEYPGQPGAVHTYRAEDMQNFTLLLKELRNRFTQQGKADGRRLYLTIAAGASDEYLAHTEMDKVQGYVDAVNLMAYDYNEGPAHGRTTHQAPLFVDPDSPIQESADTSVRAFEQAGVPAAKLILGVPFYGRSWEQVSNTNHGLFQPGKPAARDFIPFAEINGSLIGHGFTRFWDALASAPYLYSPDQKIFISYEDPESLARKCSYVLAHRLGGVMFWEYSDDPNGVLLGVIEHALHRSSSIAR
jgi:chitinase